MSKYIFFLLHYVLILYILYPFSPGNTILAIIVYVSWILNDNFCILTQMEYLCFNQTCFLIGVPRAVSKYEKCLLLLSQIIKMYFLM